MILNFSKIDSAYLGKNGLLSCLMAKRFALNCLVIVAHPDDETIWMGGTIIRHPYWNWHIMSLCRTDDSDRSPRFHKVISELGAVGYISDLDDSPTLAPLSANLVEIKKRIQSISLKQFDLIFTHGPKGEYTRHLRHEQVHQAVREMVESGDLIGTALFFTYEDCSGECTPRPSEDAHIRIKLSSAEIDKKQHIIRDIYGFNEASFEYKSIGSVEAFFAHNIINLEHNRNILDELNSPEGKSASTTTI